MIDRLMVFETEISEIHEKNVAKNSFFFRLCFWVDCGRGWGRFGEGFGKILEGVWRLLGSLRSLFGVFFWCLYSECSPKGLLEAPGLDVRSTWKGPKRVLGKVLGGVSENLEGQKLSL